MRTRTKYSDGITDSLLPATESHRSARPGAAVAFCCGEAGSRAAGFFGAGAQLPKDGRVVGAEVAVFREEKHDVVPELKIAQFDHTERARRLLRTDGRTVEKRHAVAAFEQGLDRADVADLDRAGKVCRRKTALPEVVFEDHARARPLLAQQQRLAQQLRELPSPVTRGLVRCRGSDIFLRAKDEKVILRLREIPLDHGKIQLPGVKLAQQHLRIRHLHPDAAVRVQVHKPAERLVEHELRDRERCAEGIVARAGGRLLHPLLQVLLVVLHRQQRPPQDLSRLGQLQALAVVPEQRRAVCLLQIAYVVRDRRLRDAQLPRRFREIHVPADGQKGLHAKIQHKRPSFPVVFPQS